MPEEPPGTPRGPPESHRQHLFLSGMTIVKPTHNQTETTRLLGNPGVRAAERKNGKDLTLGGVFQHGPWGCLGIPWGP